MKREFIECDCCGELMKVPSSNWEDKPFHFELTLPRDGINGGKWSMDLCGDCRREMHDIIRNAIENKRVADSLKAERIGRVGNV